jgi:hypothetical protein
MPVQHITLRLMDNQNDLTKNWNNTLESLQTSIKTIGATYYPWPNSPSMPGPMPLPRKPLLNSSWVTSLVSTKHSEPPHLLL